MLTQGQGCVCAIKVKAKVEQLTTEICETLSSTTPGIENWNVFTNLS